MRLQPLASYALSQFIGNFTGAQANQCYQNAWKAVSSQYIGIVVSSYVEGWLVMEQPEEILLIEHGWNVLIDGRILDSTLPFLVTPEHPVAYFPGISYTPAQVLGTHEGMLPFVRAGFGENGLLCPAYKRAYENALESAKAIAGKAPLKRLVTHRVILEEEDAE